jgi:hypothetical protein
VSKRRRDSIIGVFLVLLLSFRVRIGLVSFDSTRLVLT